MDKEQLKNKLSEIEDKLITVEQVADDRINLLCEAENSYEVNKFLFEESHCLKIYLGLRHGFSFISLLREFILIDYLVEINLV